MLRKTCSSLVYRRFENYFSTSFICDNVENVKLKEDTNQKKILRVGVIGMPNVGKSTLINAVTGMKLLPVSKKIDTTVSNTIAILTEGNTQIEFEDTPGIHNKLKSIRHKKRCSVKYTHNCMKSSDLCMVVADLSSRKTSHGYLQPEILLHLITHRNIPTILILNKVDQLSNPNQVLDTISHLTSGYLSGRHAIQSINKLVPIKLNAVESTVIEAEGSWNKIDSLDDVDLAKKENYVLNQLRSIRAWPYFKDVFVISAKRKQNVDQLKKYLLNAAKPGDWKHEEDVITTASSEEILKTIMRSSLLDNLHQEVPYETNVLVSDIHETEEEISIIYCLTFKNPKYERFLRRSKRLLCFSAARRLQYIFGKEVSVEILIS